jgi:ABC-2 type transport system permease protein
MMISYVFPTENTLKDLPFGVVNQDEGVDDIVVGDLVVEMLAMAPYGEEQKFVSIVNLGSEEEVKAQIEDEKIEGAIFIPPDFTEKMMARIIEGEGEPATITFFYNQADPQMALLLGDVLPEALYNIPPGEVEELAIKHGFTPKDAKALSNHIPPLMSAIENVPPGPPNYFEAMSPGIIAIVAMTSVMLGMAMSVTEEKESGTLDGILAAPINRMSILLGKVFSQMTRGFLQTLIVLGLSVAALGMVIHGSVPLVILLLFLTIFSFMGMGILISSIVSKQETAVLIAMTIMVPMIFLCDALFPVEQMPSVMQSFAQVIPLKYSVDALRQVIVLGGTTDVARNIGILLGSGAALFAIAVLIFRRLTTR